MEDLSQLRSEIIGNLGYLRPCLMYSHLGSMGQNLNLGVGKMAPQVPATKDDDLGLIPGILMVKEENQLLQIVL